MIYAEWSNDVCIPNKTEDLNHSVVNMVTGINESKALSRHMYIKCRCKVDGKKLNPNQWWNNDKCQCDF